MPGCPDAPAAGTQLLRPIIPSPTIPLLHPAPSCLQLVGEDPSRFEDPEGEDDFEEFEGAQQQQPPSAAQNGAR